MEILEQDVPILNNLIVDDDTKSVIQWTNPSLHMHHNYSFQAVCYILIRETFCRSLLFIFISHVKLFSRKFFFLFIKSSLTF